MRANRGPTSARTRFTIAGFAGKGFGGYGNRLTSQAAFASGHFSQGEAEQNHERAEEPAPVEAVVVETWV